MKFFEILDVDKIEKKEEKRTCALGYFDGIHIAHRKIIESAVEKAKKENKISVLITFLNSPKNYIKNQNIKIVTPNKLKKRIIENLGIEELYFLEFNDKLKKLKKEEFVNKVLKKLNIKDVFCGEDYKFGYMGEGTPMYIKENHKEINVNILNIEKIEENKISTSIQKKYILSGEVENYKKITQRYYQISGIVVRGKQLGRTIGFPTANLKVTDYIIPQKNGVYLTVVEYNDRLYKGITNIGYNPTVSADNNLSIETHILNFDEDIYDKEINIYFCKYIREEKKFNDMNELKKQLNIDKKVAEKEEIDFNKIF